MIRGLRSGKFGEFEWAKTVNWQVLVIALIAAVATFGASDVIPALEGAGGLWALVAAMAVPLIRAVQQWLSDNSRK